MECIVNRQSKITRRLFKLFVCVFAVSCLALAGCATSQTSSSQQTSSRSSNAEIRNISDVPNALSKAMQEVKGCKMTLEPNNTNNNSTLYLYEDSERVGTVELSEDDYSFTVRIDGDRSNESKDRALERVAHMTLASVIACNPGYDYSKAQDVAVGIIKSDGEYRDGKISYKNGKKSYQYVLSVYL